MHFVSLGQTGLKASRLGFGCSQIASVSTNTSTSEVRATLLGAIDNGVNFFDTADVYGQGDSERLLGKLLKGHRHRVILCSKAGLKVRVNQSLLRYVKPLVNPLVRHFKATRGVIVKARRGVEHHCFTPQYLKKQIEGSLRRLGSDYLDVFLLHSPPLDVITDEAVLSLLQDLKEAGSIRNYGVSCDNLQVALAALEYAEFNCIQVPVNIMHPAIADSVLPVAKAKNVAIIAREPLSAGKILQHPRFVEIARHEFDYTPVQLALSYTFYKADTSVILTGMSNRQHLEENIKCLDLPPIGIEEMKRLEKTITDFQVGHDDQ